VRGPKFLALQRVPGVADGILHFACCLLGFAIDLQLGIADELADGFLGRADHLLAGDQAPAMPKCGSRG